MLGMGAVEGAMLRLFVSMLVVFPAIILFWGMLVCAPAGVYGKSRPNFVLIHLDDVGYGDLSFYSQVISMDSYKNDRHSLSPNVDKLATEGIAFSSYYSSACVCTPSRAGILTGRYPIRTTMFPGVIGPTNDKGLPLEEVTIAEWLKEKAGYSTFMVGKWHLGHIEPFLPHFQGFDKWTGMPYSHDYCPCPTSLTNTIDNKCRYWDPPCPIMNGSLIVQQPAILNDIMDYYVAAFKEFMDEALKKGKPFFAYYACQHTHHPQFVKQSNIGISERMGGRADAYGDAVVEMDDAIGRIVDYLKVKKIADNTYVFITSDNGGANVYGSLSGINSPLRCGKGTTWEGGQRVPFVVWGGKTQKGKILHDIVAGMDIFPTISTLAGVSMDNFPRTTDGIDFSGLLLGTASAGKRDHFVYYSLLGDLDAVRVGKYKVHFGTSLWVNARNRDCHPNGIKIGRQSQPLVYDLENDITESRALGTANPTRDAIIRKAKGYASLVNCTMKLLGKGTCDETIKMNCYAAPGEKNPMRLPPEPFHPWTQTPRACCHHGYDVVMSNYSNTSKYTCKKMESLDCAINHNLPCNPSQDRFPRCKGRAICMQSDDNGSINRECGLAEPDGHGRFCNETWIVEHCPVGFFQCRQPLPNGNPVCTKVFKKCKNDHGGVGFYARACGSCPYTPPGGTAEEATENDSEEEDFTPPDGALEEAPPGAVIAGNDQLEDESDDSASDEAVQWEDSGSPKLNIVIVAIVVWLVLMCGCAFMCLNTLRRYRASLQDRPHVLYTKQNQVIPDEETTGANAQGNGART